METIALIIISILIGGTIGIISEYISSTITYNVKPLILFSTIGSVGGCCLILCLEFSSRHDQLILSIMASLIGAISIITFKSFLKYFQ